MERYTFSAATAKSDVYVGLLFPALIMLPILAIQLILFYLKLSDVTRSHPNIFILLVLPVLISAFISLKNFNRDLSKTIPSHLTEAKLPFCVMILRFSRALWFLANSRARVLNFSLKLPH